jgi:hypothetical protein
MMNAGAAVEMALIFSLIYNICGIYQIDKQISILQRPRRARQNTTRNGPIQAQNAGALKSSEILLAQ